MIGLLRVLVCAFALSVHGVFAQPTTPTVPGAPGSGTALPGNGLAVIAFTLPASDGGAPITGYTAACVPGAVSATGLASPIIVKGLLNDVNVACSVTAGNQVGNSAASANAGVTPSASTPFALAAVQSRKTHGSAGTFDLVIDATQPVGGNITVEPRVIGSGHTMAFQFNGPVASAGSVSVAPIGTATAMISSNELVVALNNIPDNQRVSVSLLNVNGSSSPPPVSVNFLTGDVNNTRSVNSSDISGLKARSGQATTGANFRFDLNASGAINSSDISTVKARSGLTLPFEPVSIIAVGDIAQCNGLPAADSDAAKTAVLIDSLAPLTPLLLLGDLAYVAGTPAEYQNCYDPTYGRFKARSYPAPGNHDYGVAGADTYYSYFGSRAGPDRRGYYSVDIGSWHVISLNSNIDMTVGSPQEIWLRADLAANRNKKCTLAYWHHPRFSSSSVHGNDPRSTDVWRTLYEFNADVVLVGHDHTYERFAPQDPDANADPIKGIRQFVIGTGGAGLYGFGAPQPNSEIRGAGSFGVARFSLGDGMYRWEFLPIPGNTFTDSGEANCVQ